MIYSFSISKEFFFDLSEENYEDLNYILDFINEHFIEKENFYFIICESINDKRLYQGYNGAQIKNIIQKLIAKSIPNTNIKKVDFLIYSKEKFNSKIKSISLDEIKYASTELRKELVKLSPKKVSIQKNYSFTENLEEQLKRVLQFANLAILIDRHVPRTICQNKHIHLHKAKETFKIIKNSSTIPIEFLGNLMSIKKLIKDNHLSLKPQNDQTIKNAIQIFFQDCLKNSKITIKEAQTEDGFNAWQFLLDYRGMYLIINEIHYSFIDCGHGLSFYDKKGKIPVKLELMDTDDTKKLNEHWENIVQKPNDYLSFST